MATKFAWIKPPFGDPSSNRHLGVIGVIIASRRKLVSIPYPGKMVLIAENTMSKEDEFNARWFNKSDWEPRIGFQRHGGRANILFCDFSVRSVAPGELTDANIDPLENQ